MSAEEGAAGAAEAVVKESAGFAFSSTILFLLALCVPVAILGLFARKLLLSEQEKEQRRLEKKKAKEQRNKKK